MKKLLLLLVLLAVGMTTLFAIGQSKGNGSKGATPLNIIVPGERPKDMEMVIDALEKAVLDELGPIDLSLEFIGFPDYNQKLALKVAAAEEMDLIFDPAWLNFYQMQAQGAFMPLNDLIKDLSFYGVPGNISDVLWGAVSVDGKIYGLPAVENNYVRRADKGQLTIRADLVEKYAPAGISTGPQLLNFIRKVKANEPQFLALNAERTGKLPLSPAVLYGQDGVGTALWGELNGGAGGLVSDPVGAKPPKVFSAFFTKEFENDVAAAIKLQKEGLITFEEVSDKRASFVAGRMAMIGGDIYDYSQSIYPAVKDTFGVKWVRLEPKPKGVLMRASGNWFCISTTSKAPELAAKFVNWIMSSQANYELWAYGIEGTHYNISEKGTIQKINPEERNYEMLWWYVFNRAHLRQDMSETPDAKAFEDWSNVDANSLPNPTIGFPYNQEPIKSEIAQVRVIISEFNGLNLGLNPASDIEKFRKQLMDAGLQTILDETNRQIEEWYAANN